MKRTESTLEAWSFVLHSTIVAAALRAPDRRHGREVIRDAR